MVVTSKERSAGTELPDNLSLLFSDLANTSRLTDEEVFNLSTTVQAGIKLDKLIRNGDIVNEQEIKKTKKRLEMPVKN